MSETFMDKSSYEIRISNVFRGLGYNRMIDVIFVESLRTGFGKNVRSACFLTIATRALLITVYPVVGIVLSLL